MVAGRSLAEAARSSVEDRSAEADHALPAADRSSVAGRTAEPSPVHYLVRRALSAGVHTAESARARPVASEERRPVAVA